MFIDTRNIALIHATEELLLIVRATVSLVHFNFLCLKSLPQVPVLDSLNLEEWKSNPIFSLENNCLSGAQSDETVVYLHYVLFARLFKVLLDF